MSFYSYNPKFKIEKPTVIVDKNICQNNIKFMKEKADKSNVELRPHFKTHQSAEIGEWFRNSGINKITVSSAEMAEYFVENGWKDITIAFPLNIHELDKIDQLAAKSKIGILIDNDFSLKKALSFLTNRVFVWIKIDCGYRRSGIKWNKKDEILNLVHIISQDKKHSFAGLLSHFGNTYSKIMHDDIRVIFEQSSERILSVAEHLKLNGMQDFKVSIGDTPSCSLIEDLSAFDEIRPGNFIFYDLMQLQKNVCDDSDIAVALACPIVGKYDDRQEIVIYGGAVHLSKEFINDSNGNRIYGNLRLSKNNKLGKVIKEAPVVSLSQEHGILSPGKEIFEKLAIGDIILITPVHSCLTIDLYNHLVLTDGEIIHKI